MRRSLIFLNLLAASCASSALVRINVSPEFTNDGCQQLRAAATNAGYTLDVPEGVDGWDVAAGRSDCANVVVGEDQRMLFWQIVEDDSVRVEIVASAKDSDEVADLLGRGEQLLAEVASAPTTSAIPLETNRWIDVPDPVGDTTSVQIRKLAVPDLVAPDLPESVRRALTDLVLTEGSKVSGLNLTSPSEVAAILGLERQKELLGCEDDITCLAEIGGALGVDGLLIANIGHVGVTHIATFKVIDTGENRAVLRLTAKAKGDPDVLIDVFEAAVPRLLQRLVAKP